ncbi:MAG: type I restriction endonuclease subunit R, partial [Bacteroidales bacterium]|nr:type I restriction endonuclease subunit R [Bacteroidales bacterium]
ADLYNVYMTTELKGADTFFLPFNQGSNGAGNIGDGGNPTNGFGYATSHLWEQVLRRDRLLAILQRYISLEKKETIRLEGGKKKKEHSEKIIFPRYHQFDVVERLVRATHDSTEGRNFLIQHSAGSGKSNSIAWLTYRLSSLHDADDNEMFQTVFVVTDRRVLNRQLQETILGFDHKVGQIVTITDKDNSAKLREAINDKKRIIITTLHRFPLIYKELDGHEGKRFAIIVDEAHSSQSGKSAEKLKAALADTEEALRELAEVEGRTEEALKDDMDVMTETLLTQGRHKNEYFYAFTATPKPKTLQTFGEPIDNDATGETSFTAFHHYSMRQAIDEGFILDVLRFFTPIETIYKVAKAVADNPEYEEPPAMKAVREYHGKHPFVIADTARLIVEEFRAITLTKINGKAKAMVVSPSRANAVLYYLAIKRYCREKGYTDVRPLVAFSGTVTIDGKDYTETQLNSDGEVKISESALPMYFASDMYNILVVAEKYQTGFDEPLLHTMFVLKGLSGVKAVQTLSRLNRSCKDKIDTYVFDFVNSAEEIQAAFKPFYEDTLLAEPIDVNVVYRYLTELKSFHLWGDDAEEAVYAVYNERQDSKTLGRLSSVLKPVVEDYALLDEEERFKVRGLIKSFVRFYAYMAQIARTFDRDLFKSYIFCEYLYKLLPRTPHEKVDLDGKLRLEQHMFRVLPSGAIDLKPTAEEKTIKGVQGGRGRKTDEKRDLLDNIIEKINRMYQGDFTDSQNVMVGSILDRMLASAKTLAKLARTADVNMFVHNIFPKYFEKVAQTCYTEQVDSYHSLFENQQLYQIIMEAMAQGLYFQLKNENATSSPIPYTPDDESSELSAVADSPETFDKLKIKN